MSNNNFKKIDSNAVKEIRAIKGIFRKTLVHNNKIMMIKFRLEKDSDLPIHSHHHYQMGYIISGKLKFIVNGKEEILKGGDSYIIDTDINHGVKVLENSVVIDIFTPPREDYL
ncbi:MAG: cupin domain-containing protein [Candidatus Lokiarchaeota archaeon]|nr:cupin domain-containing protein [Candidatus Lokiarchaeota archaeon]